MSFILKAEEAQWSVQELHISCYRELRIKAHYGRARCTGLHLLKQNAGNLKALLHKVRIKPFIYFALALGALVVINQNGWMSPVLLHLLKRNVHMCIELGHCRRFKAPRANVWRLPPFYIVLAAILQQDYSGWRPTESAFHIQRPFLLLYYYIMLGFFFFFCFHLCHSKMCCVLSVVALRHSQTQTFAPLEIFDICELKVLFC